MDILDEARRRSSSRDPTKKKKKKVTGENGSERKRKKRVPKVRRSASSVSATAVCAAFGGAAGPGGGTKLSDGDVTTAGSTKLGLTIVILVLTLYLFGTIESVRSLPEVNPNMKPNWFGAGSAARGLAIHGGGNINVARDGLVPMDDDDDDDDASSEGSEEGDDGEGGDDEEESEEEEPAEENKNQLHGDVERAHQMPMSVNGKPVNPVVPDHKWPVSIRNEDGNFEDIMHPGDDTQIMSVPRFWSDPVHANKLMSRTLAMSIGSCIKADRKGNHAVGDDCPKNDRTIFVAIASYRDWQCRYTVESIFTRATYPERVRVGVVDQIVADEDFSCESSINPCSDDPEQALCKHRDLIDVFQMDAIYAVGPVFARHVGHRMYRGEYYTMQSDAHVTFTKGWDVDIINQQESIGNDMAVQSTYLTDIVGSIDERTGLSKRNTRPIMCNTDYEGGVQGKHLRHGSQPERHPSIYGMPQLQPYWAAGFSFSRGHFVVNVPYDQYQPMIFQGEEMSIGLRGFTIGYDYYATEKSVCFHHYAEGPNAAKRRKVKSFWEHADKYAGTGKKAMTRLLGIVGMNPEVDPSTWDHSEEDRYGCGKVRTTQKFYDTFGIDVVHKRTEHNLCEFVQTGIMHNDFMKFLRKDGMGIDYNKISYRFKNPMKN